MHARVANTTHRGIVGSPFNRQPSDEVELVNLASCETGIQALKDEIAGFFAESFLSDRMVHLVYWMAFCDRMQSEIDVLKSDQHFHMKRTECELVSVLQQCCQQWARLRQVKEEEKTSARAVLIQYESELERSERELYVEASKLISKDTDFALQVRLRNEHFVPGELMYDARLLWLRLVGLRAHDQRDSFLKKLISYMQLNVPRWDPVDNEDFEQVFLIAAYMNQAPVGKKILMRDFLMCMYRYGPLPDLFKNMRAVCVPRGGELVTVRAEDASLAERRRAGEVTGCHWLTAAGRGDVNLALMRRATKYTNGQDPAMTETFVIRPKNYGRGEPVTPHVFTFSFLREKIDYHTKVLREDNGTYRLDTTDKQHATIRDLIIYAIGELKWEPEMADYERSLDNMWNRPRPQTNARGHFDRINTAIERLAEQTNVTSLPSVATNIEFDSAKFNTAMQDAVTFCEYLDACARMTPEQQHMVELELSSFGAWELRTHTWKDVYPKSSVSSAPPLAFGQPGRGNDGDGGADDPAAAAARGPQPLEWGIVHRLVENACFNRAWYRTLKLVITQFNLQNLLFSKGPANRPSDVAGFYPHEIALRIAVSAYTQTDVAADARNQEEISGNAIFVFKSLLRDYDYNKPKLTTLRWELFKECVTAFTYTVPLPEERTGDDNDDEIEMSMLDDSHHDHSSNIGGSGHNKGAGSGDGMNLVQDFGIGVSDVLKRRHRVAIDLFGTFLRMVNDKWRQGFKEVLRRESMSYLASLTEEGDQSQTGALEEITFSRPARDNLYLDDYDQRTQAHLQFYLKIRALSKCADFVLRIMLHRSEAEEKEIVPFQLFRASTRYEEQFPDRFKPQDLEPVAEEDGGRGGGAADDSNVAVYGDNEVRIEMAVSPRSQDDVPMLRGGRPAGSVSYAGGAGNRVVSPSNASSLGVGGGGARVDTDGSLNDWFEPVVGGESPTLMVARNCRQRSPFALLRYFWKWGARMNRKDADDQTMLHFVARRPQLWKPEQLATLFLEPNAYLHEVVNSRDTQQITPLAILYTECHKQQKLSGKSILNQKLKNIEDLIILLLFHGASHDDLFIAHAHDDATKDSSDSGGADGAGSGSGGGGGSGAGGGGGGGGKRKNDADGRVYGYGSGGGGIGGGGVDDDDDFDSKDLRNPFNTWFSKYMERPEHEWCRWHLLESAVRYSDERLVHLILYPTAKHLALPYMFKPRLLLDAPMWAVTPEALKLGDGHKLTNSRNGGGGANVGVGIGGDDYSSEDVTERKEAMPPTHRRWTSLSTIRSETWSKNSIKEQMSEFKQMYYDRPKQSRTSKKKKHLNFQRAVESLEKLEREYVDDSILLVAIRNKDKNRKIVEMLLNYQATDADKEDSNDKYLNTPLTEEDAETLKTIDDHIGKAIDRLDFPELRRLVALCKFPLHNEIRQYCMSQNMMARDAYGMSPLHIACSVRHDVPRDIIDLLIDTTNKRGDLLAIDDHGFNVLHHAAHTGRLYPINQLINTHYPPNRCQHEYDRRANKKSSQAAVESQRHKKARVKDDEQRHWALQLLDEIDRWRLAVIGESDPEYVDEVVTRHQVLPFERTALHIAAMGGDWQVCASLLAAQANVDKIDNDGWTPLALAMYMTMKLNELVKYLETNELKLSAVSPSSSGGGGGGSDDRKQTIAAHDHKNDELLPLLHLALAGLVVDSRGDHHLPVYMEGFARVARLEDWVERYLATNSRGGGSGSGGGVDSDSAERAQLVLGDLKGKYRKMTSNVVDQCRGLNLLVKCRDQLKKFESTTSVLLDKGADIKAATKSCSKRFDRLINTEAAFVDVHESIRDVDREIADAHKQSVIQLKKARRDEIFKVRLHQIVIEEYFQKYVRPIQMARLVRFAIFLLVLTLLGLMETTRNERAAYFMQRGLHESLIRGEYPSRVSAFYRTFEDIDSTDEVWQWLKGPFLDTFYPEESSKYWEGSTKVERSGRKNHAGGYLLQHNRILGVPRLRQVRSRETGCDLGSEYDALLVTCFTDDADDYHSFGPTGTEYTYSTEWALKGIWTDGRVDRYPGSGYVYNMPAPITTNNTSNRLQALTELSTLEKNEWIDTKTRAVFVEFSVLNGNHKLFIVGKVMVEFPRSGGIVPSSQFDVLRLKKYFWDEQTGWVIALEVFVILYMLFDFIETSKKYLQLPDNRGSAPSLNFLGHVLTYLLFVAIVVLHVLTYVWVDRTDLRDDVTYVQVTREAHWISVENALISLLVFVSWIRLLQYAAVFRTVARLMVIINMMLKQLATFLLLFLVILIAFSSAEYISYGYKSSTSYLWIFAFITRLSQAFAGREIDDFLTENRIMGTFYDICFVIAVALLLMNLIIAMMNTGYTIANEDVGDSFWARVQYEMIVKASNEYPIVLIGYIPKCRKCISWEEMRDWCRSKTNSNNNNMTTSIASSARRVSTMDRLAEDNKRKLLHQLMTESETGRPRYTPSGRNLRTTSMSTSQQQQQQQADRHILNYSSSNAK